MFKKIIQNICISIALQSNLLSVTCPQVSWQRQVMSSPTGQDWSGCDLSGTVFYYADPCDFSGTNITDTDFSNARFRTGGLACANLSDSAPVKSFKGAIWTDGNKCIDNQCKVKLQVDTSPRSYLFLNHDQDSIKPIDLSGVNFGAEDYSGPPSFTNIGLDFSNVILSNATLYGLNLRYANFTNAILTNASLENAIVILPENGRYGFTHFDGVDLTNANLKGIKHWNYKDSSGSTQNVTDQQALNLVKSAKHLTGIRLPSGNQCKDDKCLLIVSSTDNSKPVTNSFTNMDLSGVNFTDIKLDGLDLSGTVLKNALGLPADPRSLGALTLQNAIWVDGSLCHNQNCSTRHSASVPQCPIDQEPENIPYNNTLFYTGTCKQKDTYTQNNITYQKTQPTCADDQIADSIQSTNYTWYASTCKQKDTFTKDNITYQKTPSTCADDQIADSIQSANYTWHASTCKQKDTFTKDNITYQKTQPICAPTETQKSLSSTNYTWYRCVAKPAQPTPHTAQQPQATQQQKIDAAKQDLKKATAALTAAKTSLSKATTAAKQAANVLTQAQANLKKAKTNQKAALQKKVAEANNQKAAADNVLKTAQKDVQLANDALKKAQAALNALQKTQPVAAKPITTQKRRGAPL